MRRRAFLASALTATSTSVAGCTALDSRTEHTDPTVEAEDNPQENGKYLVFHDDGEELADVGVHPSFSPSPEVLTTSIWHSGGTELRSLTQRFVAIGGDGTPPRLSLQGPFMGGHEPHPSVSLYREGRAAVVEVHRFGDLADETAYIQLPVSRWPESAGRLAVESTVELVETGLLDRTHVLDGRLEFELPEESEAGEGNADTSGSSG